MKNHSESGLSLIEAVIALMLLSIALTGLAVGFAPSRGAVHTGSQLTRAVGLAQQTLEDMRGRQYTPTVDQITPANFPDQGYGIIQNFLDLRRTVLIQDGVPQANCAPPPPTPCSKTVTVTVFYRDAAGEQSVRLRTIFVR